MSIEERINLICTKPGQSAVDSLIALVRELAGQPCHTGWPASELETELAAERKRLETLKKLVEDFDTIKIRKAASSGIYIEVERVDVWWGDTFADDWRGKTLEAALDAAREEL